MKFWWLLFLALKFTFLFLNLAKLHIYIPKKIDYHHPGLPPQLPYHQEAEEAVASLEEFC